MATHSYFSNLLSENSDKLYDAILNYMSIYSNCNFYSGSFDSHLQITSLCTTSDGLCVKKGHRNWFWSNIFEDMSANGFCYKKSVMSENGKKVLVNLYSATPFDNKFTYAKSSIYNNSHGMKIKNTFNNLIRITQNYMIAFPETVFTSSIIRKATKTDSYCTTIDGNYLNKGHMNWFYVSLLEHLAATEYLWKLSVTLPQRKRPSVFYSFNPIDRENVFLLFT